MPMAGGPTDSGQASRGGREFLTVLLHHRQPDFSRVTQHAEAVQQPENDRDHDDGVKDRFDRSGHRNVGVDEPEQHADDDQS